MILGRTYNCFLSCARFPVALTHAISPHQVDQMQDADFLEARLQEAEALTFANGKSRFQRVDAVSALAPLSLEPLKV
jgi:hypothetical protein